MTVKMKRPLTVTLGAADMAALVTDGLCGYIGPFENLSCEWVSEGTKGVFTAQMMPRARTAEPVRAQGPETQIIAELREKVRAHHANQAKVAGGIARAEALTPERRSEIARNAVNARWARKREAEGQGHG